MVALTGWVVMVGAVAAGEEVARITRTKPATASQDQRPIGEPVGNNRSLRNLHHFIF